VELLALVASGLRPLQRWLVSTHTSSRHPYSQRATGRDALGRFSECVRPTGGRTKNARRHGVTCASNDSGALRVRGVRLVGLSLHGDLGQWEIADGELSVGHASELLPMHA
jgi:hypothetical protein